MERNIVVAIDAMGGDNAPFEIVKGVVEAVKLYPVKVLLVGKEDIVKRMSEEGHLIGNHSYEHIQLTKAGAKAVCEAVEHTQEQIEAITGKRPEYIRPPYGDWNEELEEEIGMTPVLWSLDSLDWKLKDTGKIIRQVLKDVKDGDIILLHDIFPSSVEAALELVDILQKEGYVFVTADELLIE